MLPSAAKSIHVKVTQDHIDRGRKGECRLCPIALALSEKGYQDVVVGVPCGTEITVTLSNDGKFQSYILPQKASYWIEDFDRDKVQLPIEFDMTLWSLMED